MSAQENGLCETDIEPEDIESEHHRPCQPESKNLLPSGVNELVESAGKLRVTMEAPAPEGQDGGRMGADKSALVGDSAVADKSSVVGDSAVADKSAVVGDSPVADKSAVIEGSAVADKSALVEGLAVADKSAVVEGSAVVGEAAAADGVESTMDQEPEPTQGPLASTEQESNGKEKISLTELTQEELGGALSSGTEEEGDVFQDARDKVSPCSEGGAEGEEWRDKDKHIFVLSEAGKPIYTLHGDEEMLVSLFGVMQALVSYVADSKDTIRSIRTADTTIVFLNKPSLTLVAVSRTGLSSQQLTFQLTYIYNQILSVLTLTQLNRIFEQRRNYDLRRMLSGSERLMNHLSASMDTDPSYFLSSVRCLSLAPAVRDAVSESIIRYCGKMSNVVFGVMVADNQLVTLVRMKKYFIHPADLHLLFNLIQATESFKNSESWTPICLPKFDPSGFLHAHVSYISDKICIVLITVDRNAFFELSAARANIKQRMEKLNTMSAIVSALEKSSYDCNSIDLPELRHFLYKSRTSAQYTAPVPAPCYRHPDQMKRLFSLFLSIQNRLHVASRPVKICYRATALEIVLGWSTQSFELYAVFSPTATKLSVLTAVNNLLRWIKKEEERLFILTAPTF